MKDGLEKLQNFKYTHDIVSGFYIREKRATRIHRWNSLTRYLGLKLNVIISDPKDSDHWRFHARWPLPMPFGLSYVVTGDLVLQNYFPSLTRLILRPQNTIPTDSAIVKACQASDISELRYILENQQGHPNDRTVDDLTVFRVRPPNFHYRTTSLRFLESLLFISALLMIIFHSRRG